MYGHHWGKAWWKSLMPFFFPPHWGILPAVEAIASFTRSLSSLPYLSSGVMHQKSCGTVDLNTLSLITWGHTFKSTNSNHDLIYHLRSTEFKTVITAFSVIFFPPLAQLNTLWVGITRKTNTVSLLFIEIDCIRNFWQWVVCSLSWWVTAVWKQLALSYCKSFHLYFTQCMNAIFKPTNHKDTLC